MDCQKYRYWWIIFIIRYRQYFNSRSGSIFGIEKSQFLKDELTILIDEDTNAFNLVLNAYKLPSISNDDIKKRNLAIEDSMKYAASVPFKTLNLCSCILWVQLLVLETFV